MRPMLPLPLVLLVICSNLMGASPPAANRDEVHRVDSVTWQTEPVSPSVMNQRVEETAKEYEQYAPIPRVALYDIAYPKDAAEFQQMDGYSILLMVVLTHDPSEIPPARVYASCQGKELPLTLINSLYSKTYPGSLVEKVLGANRWEGLYLLPTYLRIDSKQLLIDFAAHRKNFIFADLSESGPPLLEYSSIIRKPRGKRPPNQALGKFIEREFPGFISK